MSVLAIIAAASVLRLLVASLGLEVASALLAAAREFFAAAPRPANYDAWEIACDDADGLGAAWPAWNVVDFAADYPVIAEAPAVDLDNAPALTVAAAFLDLRREMFGSADESDESAFLVEMACFLGAAGHGATRAARDLDEPTPCATPCAARWAPVRTLVPIDPAAITISA